MRTVRAGLVLVLLVAVVVCSAFTAFAADAESPRVRVELLSEVQSMTAGETFWVALRQRIAPGWHTYWMNPGDSGEPVRIEWALPDGFVAGDIAWPYPERIASGPAMSYGYAREVVLPIPVTATRNLAPGTRVTLRGQASWLVCEKICIPEEASVALTLSVAAGPPRPDPSGAPLIAAARRAVPTPSPWPASFVATRETVTLTVAARGLVAERIEDVWFYPAQWGAIQHAAPQRSRTDIGGLTLEVARGPLPEAVTRPIEGVLVVTERLDGDVASHAFAVRAEPRSPAVLGSDRGLTLSLLRALALAFAGGLVLNLMPCVLPVLSVKALGLVQHGHGRSFVLRRHGLARAYGCTVKYA